MSKKIMHPQIFSLITQKNEIRNHLAFRQFLAGLDKMYYLIMELEKEDHDGTLFTKVRNERTTVRSFTHPGSATRHMKTKSRKYEEWYDEMMVILNTKGYLTNQKYGFDLKEDDLSFE